MNIHESPTILGEWIAKQRWFGGKSRILARWRIEASKEVGRLVLIAIRAEYADGASETYFAPLAYSQNDHVIPGFSDAISDPAFHEWLHKSLLESPTFRRDFRGESSPTGAKFEAEQSNSALILNGGVFVKIYRRLTRGLSPDAEMLSYFSEKAAFRTVPKFAGLVQWEDWPVALATSVVPAAQNAWLLALESARRFFETGNPGDWPMLARVLGKRTGEMHATLAGATGRDFEAEAFIQPDFDAVTNRIRKLESSTSKALELRLESIPQPTRELAVKYLTQAPYRWEKRLPNNAIKTRVHGDFHLGQVLWDGRDFFIIDFEGEPSRSLEDRRAKSSPIRDVAGMLRSFHYAAHSAGSGAKAEQWAGISAEQFLDGWTAAAPQLAGDLTLLPLFSREKALYELDYELNNRPDWLRIPLLALTLK